MFIRLPNTYSFEVLTLNPPPILQYLSFFASRVLWKWFFCVENQVKITYLVVAIYQACDCFFLLEPPKLLSLKSYKCLASKVVKEFL